MAEEEKDRTEPATPFKLEEARRRGQVAKSLDFNALFVIGALLAVMYAWGEGMTHAAAHMAHALLAGAAQLPFEMAPLAQWLNQVLKAILMLIAPFLGLAALAAFAANLAQTGPVFSAHPLKPDVQRLNPVNGLKRLFSMRTLFETGKTLLKLAAFAGVSYLVIAAMLPHALALQQVEPKAYMGVLLELSAALIFKLLLVLAVVALLDLAFSRWDYGKRMRMSRRELKDEVKRREGDPLVRARQRELQQELAKRAQSVKRVPEADVLITNPEHYAVALRYERERMAAPCVIAKGAGELAQALKRVALQAGVPLREDVALAQRLFSDVAIDQPVDAALFEPVARVYAWLHARSRAGLEIGLERQVAR